MSCSKERHWKIICSSPLKYSNVYENFKLNSNARWAKYVHPENRRQNTRRHNITALQKQEIRTTMSRKWRSLLYVYQPHAHEACIGPHCFTSVESCPCVQYPHLKTHSPPRYYAVVTGKYYRSTITSRTLVNYLHATLLHTVSLGIPM